ncbi:hypothetical protein J7413_12920 [Shimia sp. R10_1]|uniref:hypothetical protein n=1 Tax=Shimia sp. R10_1 TaxID=2821095 RepID=UPI001AD9BC70|nr:hypothetical protein [Shimia sp. R10_1]MBO9474446.1 hypothetical protein [Shimia sp. R10_1]
MSEGHKWSFSGGVLAIGLCALVGTAVSAQDVAVSEGLNTGPLTSSEQFQDEVVDFGALGQTQYRGKRFPVHLRHGALKIGSVFKGQYLSAHTTGNTSDSGPVIDRFGDGKTLFLEMISEGLTYGKREKYTRTVGYGAQAKKTVTVETVLGHRPLAVVFPRPQYAFGIEVKRLFRMEQHDGAGKNDRHIRVKAFGANGDVVAERRIIVADVFSASFVRCQYSQDVMALQITSNVDGGIALSKLSFDTSPKPPETTRKAQVDLPEGFEFMPCNSPMG